MKQLTIIIGLIFATLSAKAQYTPYTPGTIVDGKIPVVVYINPASPFPYKVDFLNRTSYILTYNQLKGLAKSAGRDTIITQIVTETQIVDSLCQEENNKLEEQVADYEIKYQAAMLSYQAEKEKNNNSSSLLDTKDAIIASQRKEIRNQKLAKWAAIIGGGALVTLTYLNGR